jgi:hypothetical protein
VLDTSLPSQLSTGPSYLLHPDRQRCANGAKKCDDCLRRRSQALPSKDSRPLFIARLSQFPLSFLAKSRCAPRSSGELRFKAMPPLQVSLQLIKNRKATGRLQTCRLNASPRSVSCAGSDCPRSSELPCIIDNGECPCFSPTHFISLMLFHQLTPLAMIHAHSWAGHNQMS